jgi:hypothetical protein
MQHGPIGKTVEIAAMSNLPWDNNSWEVAAQIAAARRSRQIGQPPISYRLKQRSYLAWWPTPAVSTREIKRG